MNTPTDITRTIEIRLHTVEQLFDLLDPSPFHDKALAPAAESYLLSSAKEHTLQEALLLRVHVPELSRQRSKEISSAIHAHFQVSAEAATRHYRQRMRVGRTTLGLGLATLVVCLLIRSLLTNLEHSAALIQAISEGLLILGWVAMWRPVELLLFERWENQQERLWFEKLSRIPIEFEYYAVT
jgi:hypothetical protein